LTRQRTLWVVFAAAMVVLLVLTAAFVLFVASDALGGAHSNLGQLAAD
jgi:hypothetical protein